jgi:Calcineurin-like phosphoesterase
MAFVYWSSDGAGKDVGKVHTAFIRWIRTNGSPALIVNGGDVYGDGTPEEFEAFLEQMDGDVSDICEVPGNHDWNTRSTSAATGEIPAAYEAFWSRFPPPQSRQPVDSSKRSGARYEHFVDIDDWRLVFLDTGPCGDEPWPMSDPSRVTWLRQTLTGRPGRAKIVFAHHSRLSRGKHGDNGSVDALWQALFDPATGAPQAVLTLGGHDHNVSIYGPRPRTNPRNGSVDVSNGIHIVVNGAGGRGHDTGFTGTRPDLFFDDDNYCLARINLIDERSVDLDILSFGPMKEPPAGTTPQLLQTLKIRL